jgi:type I restriction enzyme S subunit
MKSPYWLTVLPSTSKRWRPRYDFQTLETFGFICSNLRKGCPMKPGYKQTEVGEIPEEWEVKSLGEIAPLQRGFDLPATRIKHGPYPIVYSNGIMNHHEIAMVSGPGVVTGRSGTLGKVHYVERDYWPHNTSLWVTRFNGDPRFVYYLYTGIGFERFASGSGVPTLNRNDAHAYRTAIPSSLPEQRAIAEALSDVDGLLGALDRLIAKKRDLKQATMQQLLTGQTRLTGFSEKWTTLCMDKHASLHARIGWQALTTEEYLDVGSHFLVTGTDFVGGRVNWKTCHFVDEWRYKQDRNIQLDQGDVLLTKDGTIGKVGYVDKVDQPATLNSGVFVIRPVGGSFNPLFLFYILSSRIFDEFLNKITAGSTITHLYQKDFVTFEFSAPRLPEQTAIAQVLSEMDAELAGLEQRRDKTRALKQGMMQELLTGRTRLV